MLGSWCARRQRIAVGLSVGVMLSACGPAIAPRTADTAPEGELAFSGNFAPVQLGWGKVRASSRREATTEFTGGGEIFPNTDSFAWGFSASTLYDLELRYGLSEWAEIGTLVGFQRLGGEVRAAVLDEDLGAPFSLALGYGAAYSAIGDGPWMRAGVDWSVHLGHVAPMLNLYLSDESTVHSAHQGDSPCPQEGYPGTVCGELLAERQHELRLSAAAGLAFETEGAVVRGGVVPYVPLAVTHLACDECVGEVRPTWGIHFVVGGDVPRWSPRDTGW